MDNKIYGYKYTYLKQLENQIKNEIENQIKNDINNENCLINYILQDQNKYRYRNIYIDDINLVHIILSKFPLIIKNEYDEKKIYYVIYATYENLRNQELINIFIDYKYTFNNDFKIVKIPEYLETYDEIIKYNNLYKLLLY
jgi:hypothetical protein